MKNIKQLSMKTLTAVAALTFASMASATTFKFNATNLGVTAGGSYNSLVTTIDGIGLTITALDVLNDNTGNITSATPITGTGVGVYVSSSDSTPTSGNLGVRGSIGETSNLDGGSGGVLSGVNEPDEGLLFTFDALVSLDYINFDSFTSFGGDDFNLTVDGVSVLVDHNGNDTSALVTNVPGQFDEYNFNNIVGTNFLFWADGNSDSFRIDRLSVSAVPVPAAAWLFGSALLGMFGFSRRKKT